MNLGVSECSSAERLYYANNKKFAGPLTFEGELDNGIFLPRLVSNPNSWTEVNKHII